jgi:hypothetical protein
VPARQRSPCRAAFTPDIEKIRLRRRSGVRYNYAVLAFNSRYGSGVAGPVFVTTPASAAPFTAALKQAIFA